MYFYAVPDKYFAEPETKISKHSEWVAIFAIRMRF